VNIMRVHNLAEIKSGRYLVWKMRDHTIHQCFRPSWDGANKKRHSRYANLSKYISHDCQMQNRCDYLHLPVSSMAVCDVLLAFCNCSFLCDVHSKE
jgi:hypothetical protein